MAVMKRGLNVVLSRIRTSQSERVTLRLSLGHLMTRINRLEEQLLNGGFHDFYHIFYLGLNTTLEGVDFIPGIEKILKIL